MVRFPDDPNAKREHEQYENPIPSREYILKFLSEKAALATFSQIASAFNLDNDDDKEALRRRLLAMRRDGQLFIDRRQRYGLLDKSDLMRGHIKTHREGFGYFIDEATKTQYFISPRQMKKVFHGDLVLAAYIGFSKEGEIEASIVEILERANATIVGRLCFDRGLAYVIPENKYFFQDIFIPPGELGNARENEVVVVEMVESEQKSDRYYGRIKEVLGNYMAAGMEVEVAIRTHDIPFDWNQTILDETTAISDQLTKQDLKGRVDLRDKFFVTIDGADAQDFDDAIYCEALDNKGWRLYVAIADVSHYVKPDTALDKEAKNRGNSVYFPGKVIPMLPEKLSNGICSLSPHVDRLTLVSETELSADGDVIASRFYPAVIHSKARLIYEQAAELIEGENYQLMQECNDILPHLMTAYQLYLKLFENRKKRGALEFGTTETKIKFDVHKKIQEIVPRYRNVAHHLIEEFMLVANVATAEYLLKHEINSLYRIHESPSLEKLNNLRLYLKELGTNLHGGDSPTPHDYRELLDNIAERPDHIVLETLVLRSLMQAYYSPDNVGHFGLAYEAYTHFTSPIRRYPDLLVHRSLRTLIDKKRGVHYKHDELVALGEHCSMTERRADEATRDVEYWLKCEYMQDKLGEEYQGVVTSVTHFGLFVELTDLFVEGLVHISYLHNDYYHFDPLKHCLVGEYSGSVFRMGDVLKVKVARVDLESRKIDFQWIEGSTTNKKKKKSKTSKKSKNKK